MGSGCEIIPAKKSKKNLPEKEKNVNPKSSIPLKVRERIEAEIIKTCADKAKLPKNASLPPEKQLTRDQKVPCYLTGRANGLRWVLQNL